MAVDEIQDFIEQQQHGCICSGEYIGQCSGSRWRGFRGITEGSNALIACQLAG